MGVGSMCLHAVVHVPSGQAEVDQVQLVSTGAAAEHKVGGFDVPVWREWGGME